MTSACVTQKGSFPCGGGWGGGCKARRYRSCTLHAPLPMSVCVRNYVCVHAYICVCVCWDMGKRYRVDNDKLYVDGCVMEVYW